MPWFGNTLARQRAGKESSWLSLTSIAIPSVVGSSPLRMVTTRIAWCPCWPAGWVRWVGYNTDTEGGVDGSIIWCYVHWCIIQYHIDHMVSLSPISPKDVQNGIVSEIKAWTWRKWASFQPTPLRVRSAMIFDIRLPILNCNGGTRTPLLDVAGTNRTETRPQDVGVGRVAAATQGYKYSATAMIWWSKWCDWSFKQNEKRNIWRFQEMSWLCIMPHMPRMLHMPPPRNWYEQNKNMIKYAHIFLPWKSSKAIAISFFLPFSSTMSFWGGAFIHEYTALHYWKLGQLHVRSDYWIFSLRGDLSFDAKSVEFPSTTNLFHPFSTWHRGHFLEG